MKKVYASILFLFFLYIITLSNTIYGGDSGELVSSIITNSLAHPPGYSLYVLLGIFFKSLPLSYLTTAGKVTLTSLLSTTASIIVLFFIIKEIAEKKYLNYYLLAITLLVIGLNYLVWLYAVVPEVFPLNIFISLSLFYFAIRFYKEPKLRYLCLTFLFIGLGITHHHTFILILPGIFYLIYKKRNKIAINLKSVLLSLVSFGVGVLPLSFFIYSGLKKAEMSWAQTNTIGGFLEVLLRAKYGTFTASPVVLSIPQARLSQISNLINFMLNDFTLVGLILIICGFIFLIRIKKSTTKSLLLITFFNAVLIGPFFVFYANFPLLNSFFLATIERFFLVFYFLSGIFIYFGLYFVFNSIIKKIIRLYIVNPFLKKFILSVSLIILFAYPLSLFAKNYAIVYALKNDRTAENVGLDVLNSAPKKSIIVVSSDVTSFDTYYVYFDNPELKKDRIIIHTGKLNNNWYLKLLAFHYPELKLLPFDDKFNPLENIINLNQKEYNIYSEEPLTLPNIFGQQWEYYGLIYKLEKVEKISVEATINRIKKFWQNSYNKDLPSKLQKQPLKFMNLFTADILHIYAIAHRNAAQFLLSVKGNEEEAIEHIKQALILDRDDPDAENFQLLAIYNIKKKDCSRAEESINKAIYIKPTQDYIKFLYGLGINCFKSEADKKRVENTFKKFNKKQTTPLDKF